MTTIDVNKTTIFLWYAWSKKKRRTWIGTRREKKEFVWKEHNFLNINDAYRDKHFRGLLVLSGKSTGTEAFNCPYWRRSLPRHAPRSSPQWTFIDSLCWTLSVIRIGSQRSCQRGPESDEDNNAILFISRKIDRVFREKF